MLIKGIIIDIYKYLDKRAVLIIVFLHCKTFELDNIVLVQWLYRRC